MHSARSRVFLARSLAQSRAVTRNTGLRGSLLLSRSNATSPQPNPQPLSAPPPPPRDQSRWRNFLQILGRTTLITIFGGAGLLYFVSQRDRHPGAQLPFDPEKKTLVVLGSGWGASSLLKTLDTTDYNVVVVSPKNFFLFTPLLPSVAVGTLNARSIIQSTRYITRHKARSVSVIEAEATGHNSDIKAAAGNKTLKYDYLVYAVGAETQTFNIPGVKEHAVFMKELQDAERMQRQFMDCVETAAFPGQSPEEVDRLLHMVVVGGGPTGVELSGELHDFLEDDLKAWYPELAGKIRISLVEALPSVLPMFSKQLIEYTESTFKESKIDILTKTMVKEIKENSVVLQMPDKTIKEVPCGLVIWAAGNRGRKITMDLMSKFPETQTVRRGITVDDHLRLMGSEDIFAIGDCTATSYAPTAQVASQQGAYLARVFHQIARRDALVDRLKLLETAQMTGAYEHAGEGMDQAKVEKEARLLQSQLAKINPKAFQYSHQGSLAYIGSDKAIADLPFMNGNVATGGVATYLFWRSAYLSTLFSLRNRTLVATDWLKVKLFGRYVEALLFPD
ncbi:NADH dehydrogenase [Coprinopsis sp. MPI-PUGE-AT-0042]|nr:NADH dehydrogenase [Coprinopsis sp. MPI-PUGE-AT-0042]